MDIERKIERLAYVVLSLIVSTIIFLPSIRSRFGLVEIAVMTAVYAVLYFHKIIPILKLIVIPIFIYGLMCFLFGLPFQFKLGLLHPIMTLWIWIFPFLMCTCLIQRGKKWELITITAYNVILFLIITMATIKAMETFPNIMRIMTSGATDKAFFSKMTALNVGGYGIAYGCGAIMITLLGVLLNSASGKIAKNLLIIGLTVTGYIVIKAQFTTLLGLCMGAVALIVFLSIESNFIKFTTVIAALLLLTLTGPLLQILIDTYRGTAVGHHLQDLYASWFEGEEYNSYRNIYFMNGLKLFLKSPVLGIDVTTEEHYFDYMASHSTLLAVATRSGIIGCFCYLYSYWLAVRENIRNCPLSVRRNVYLPLIIYFLVLSIMNPTESDVYNYCLGFISPMIIYLISITQNETEETLEE